MNDNIDSLIGEIEHLEKRLASQVQREEVEFLYRVRQKKIRFTDEAKAEHKKLAKRIRHYVFGSRFMIAFTAPIIWSCLLPLVALDLVAFVYQAVCFPIYGIPKVRRGEYLVIDRHHLAYLNVFERLNCTYCGYANGLLAYLREIAGRTEQYWCPIKHALRRKSPHSRYPKFFDYGDAAGYRKHVEEVRRSFEDLEEEDA